MVLVGRDDRLEVVVVVHLDRLCVLELGRNGQRGRDHALLLLEGVLLDLYPFEVLEKVNVEVLAAEFTVGQVADLPVEAVLDVLCDLLVLDGAKRGSVKLSLTVLGTGIVHPFRTKEGANVLVSEGRVACQLGGCGARRQRSVCAHDTVDLMRR